MCLCRASEHQHREPFLSNLLVDCVCLFKVVFVCLRVCVCWCDFTLVKCLARSTSLLTQMMSAIFDQLGRDIVFQRQCLLFPRLLCEDSVCPLSQTRSFVRAILTQVTKGSLWRKNMAILSMQPKMIVGSAIHHSRRSHASPCKRAAYQRTFNSIISRQKASSSSSSSSSSIDARGLNLSLF